jgi:hypothetical protein
MNGGIAGSLDILKRRSTTQIPTQTLSIELPLGLDIGMAQPQMVGLASGAWKLSWKL